MRGEFEPEKFAYFELPLWLVYERGGGSAVKFAARSFLSSKKEWWQNFYQRKTDYVPLDYRNAGANGAAMRVLPIALVNAFNENKLFYESFLNAIITHGHPRAIIGTLIYAGAISFLLKNQKFNNSELLQYLDFITNNSLSFIKNWSQLDEWIAEWNKKTPNQLSFEQEFANTCVEAQEYLKAINKYIDLESNSYYNFTKALNPQYKGSGISTVLVSIYLFLKYRTSPQDALFTAVNSLGSDTDTIANFVGGLFGSHFGIEVVPEDLFEGVQDNKYLLETALQLYQKSVGEVRSNQVATSNFSRKEGLLRILAWEIGLHEMFWEALGKGDRLTHPSLGSGIIINKEIKPLPRDDYEAKLVTINFDCGQSCTFHSRVSKAGKLSESLANEIKKNFDIK
jgi:ADP-ribosylglycohydrolase